MADATAARRMMVHRCATERDAAVPDSHGAKSAPNWQPRLTGVPCRAYYTTGKFQQQPQQTQAVETLTLLLPVGTDLGRKDRVSQVTDRKGTVLFAGPLAIDGPVIRRRDHLQVTLRQVT